MVGPTTFAAAVAVPDGRESSRCGVLVVDQDPILGEVLCSGLPAYGLKVWYASDPTEAAAIFRRHRRSINLVMMESRVLEQDGGATLEALRDINPNIRVCFATECLCKQISHDLFEHGAVGILVKPFRLDGLAQALRLLAGGIRPTPA
jgi:CheY-like chemotaxis protein